MEPNLLIEYRCACGKLLFRGFILVSVIEIKCKRCGAVQTFRDDMRNIRSFMLVVDGESRVVDACEGVAVLEYSRQYVVGKLLFDILPLARDAHYQEIISNPIRSLASPGRGSQDISENTSNGDYQIRNNTLFLRDRKVSLESHIIPIDGMDSLYRVFNVIK